MGNIKPIRDIRLEVSAFEQQLLALQAMDARVFSGRYGFVGAHLEKHIPGKSEVRLVTREVLQIGTAGKSQDRNAVLEAGKKLGLNPLPMILVIPTIIEWRKHIQARQLVDQTIHPMTDENLPDDGGGPYTMLYSPARPPHYPTNSIGWLTMPNIEWADELCAWLVK